MSRARNFADLINSPKGRHVTTASSGNVTLNLSGNNSFFDAGTTTAATAVTFGTPDTTIKRFTYSFIPGYTSAASSVDDIDTWRLDSSMKLTYSNHDSKIYNPTGTKVYFADNTAECLITCNLAVPFDDTSESFDNKIHLANGGVSTHGAGIGNKIGPANILIVKFIRFNNDGTKLFIGGTNSDAVNEFHLSTPYDTGSGSISYDSAFSVATQESHPQALQFNPDGTKMIVGGLAGNGFDTYALSTGFDVSTASHSQFDLVADFTSGPSGSYDIEDFFFNADGTKVFFSRLNNYIKSFETANLSTAYDLSTGTYVSKVFNLLMLGTTSVSDHPFNCDLMPLDRISLAPTVNGRIERGTSFHPTFATSFTGYPTYFSRGYRHNLEFQTTDGGSSYTLLSHNRVQV